MKRRMRLFLMSIAGILLYSAGWSQVKYPYRFNPEKGIVDASEKPYREEVCLNGNWQFMPIFSRDTNALHLPASFSWSKTPIRIPSPWNVNAFASGNGDNFVTFPSYPKQWNKAPVAWMRKEFVVPESWGDKEIFLHFEAVAGKAVYYLNGKKIGAHFDLFFPYEMDVTPWVKPGSKNELLVAVASPKLYDKQGKYGRRTYVAGSFWGTSMRGIWQDVYLLAKPQIYLSNVYIRPKVDRDTLEVQVTIKNDSKRSRQVRLSGVVSPWKNLAGTGINEAPVQRGALGKPVLYLKNPEVRTIAAGDSIQLTLSQKVDHELAYWTPRTPNLYGLVLQLRTQEDLIDKKYTRFGWRQFLIRKDKLLLNGREIHLKGDSWHFMGVPEMTRRYAWAWFKVLKQAHANAVRLHAQPYPSFFLDVADEMGICVLDESGIWASDGGPKMDAPEFWKNCRTHIKRLVLRDRNHPAVFGWSVCNETIPVAVNVFHAPDTIVHHLLHEINYWVSLVQKLDPSRPWISGDGETQFEQELNLPTVVGHYGGENAMKHWSKEGKPWGIGEQGMAYYGTPAQVASFNGNRAYESQEGRMEGLALEAYQLIKQQRKLGASYSSIFNIVWYGLKPLALGLKDTTRQPTLTDGVFFTSFKEGVPGMQPERLGPYTTTLNPGYDPALPLYEPWPLYKAVKAANATPPADFEINPDLTSVPVVLKGFAPVKRKVFLYSSGESPLFNKLKKLGLEVSDKKANLKNALALIDGKKPPKDEAALKQIKQIAASGGLVFVIGVAPASVRALNKWLPYALKLTDRKATSFIKKKNVPVLSGLGNSDFYFTELLKKPVMQHGLSGPLVRKGTVCLSACNTDWSQWNGKPEYYKTAAVLESEREKKEAGTALVSIASGSGKYMVTSLEFNVLKGHADALIMQMLSNLGAGFNKINGEDVKVLNREGDLDAALVAGTYDASGMSIPEMSAHDFTGQGFAIEPHSGAINSGKYWQVQQADSVHAFDFRYLPLMGPRQHAVAYMSFWIYSPRSLVNLLAEPDMPVLNLEINADDGCVVILNKKKIGQSLHTGKAIVKNLPLKKGWNHFIIKVMQDEGAWKFSAHFDSDQPDFVRKLRSSVSN